MRMTKGIVLICTLTLAVSLLGGCKGNTDTKKESSTKIVKVTSVNNKTIKGVVGELEESSNKGASGSNQNETPPAKPDGNSSQNETPPAKPDGDSSQNGNPPAMPEGSNFKKSSENITFKVTDSTTIKVENPQGTEDGEVKDISKDSILEVVLDKNNNATKITIKNQGPGAGGGVPGGNSGNSDSSASNGTAATTIKSDTTVSSKTYTSSGNDENAVRIDNAKATLTDITVKKTGGDSSNNENGDFYGTNAGLLAQNGANVTIKNATVTTNAKNGNGVFSYGNNTTVNISDSKIRTTKDNSGGIQTTGGGTTNATNLDIETKGNSSAAIRSDRGGGTVNVDGGKYVTNGTGSPAVYSTATVSVKNSKLTANASEGVVVEGKNSVSLENCDVVGNMKGTYNGDSDENIHGIMIYQSMSGDAEEGEAKFSAKSGSITTKKGDLFYITNTDCTINLEDVSLKLANDTLLRVEGNNSSRGWGTAGSNGGDVVLNATNQKLAGNIIVDKISSLNMKMTKNTEYKGAVNAANSGGTVKVTLDKTSKWTLTADSYVSEFNGDTSNVKANGHHLYVDGKKVL